MMPSAQISVCASTSLDRELPVGASHAEQVRGLEVPVNDSKRVRVSYGDASLKDELHRLVDG
jgi:hypothetical protein